MLVYSGQIIERERKALEKSEEEEKQMQKTYKARGKDYSIGIAEIIAKE